MTALEEIALRWRIILIGMSVAIVLLNVAFWMWFIPALREWLKRLIKEAIREALDARDRGEPTERKPWY
ncbi:hypothetical protein H5P28_07080 [Ruficoccus amylovorans]|uniref:Uncharacterized protein n=1 Tax=Ruficoccus amylovorans TaxID=1804625 RepID=A0A842HC81_9BACT|nr:hypothetical protein [Ruficoccus amylovorans]MBC2594022.1 hypothetical protein [Ruficoccus amylovorans]